MAVYICKNCRFKVQGNQPERCPYCDKKGSLEREPSADELLGSVDEQ